MMNDQRGWGEKGFSTPPDTPPEGSTGEQPEGFMLPPREPSAESRAELERAAGLTDFRVGTAREEVEAALFADAANKVRDERPRPPDQFLGAGNVQGVGWGPAGPGSTALPGTEVLRVYVAEPQETSAVRDVLVDALGVRTAGDVPLEVVHSGLINLQNLTHRHRKAAGGLSVGHETGVQGTLGFLARGRSAPDANKLFLVSANHVIAKLNAAEYNSCIVQPAPADGGRCSTDRIALLDKVHPLDLTFLTTNYADCARAWCYPSEVVQEQLQVHQVPGTGPQYYGIGHVPQWATPNMWVGKTGCLTQTTYGRVLETNWGGLIGVPNSLTKIPFAGQISIMNPGYTFSLPGDSGAVAWSYDANANPVGLVIGGDPYTGVSVASHASWVLDYLDLVLV
ncbi:hypothetical protein OHA98_19245 [Streptomyces sp. NBC_00654]|uniref:hypothetical protein n=1 Tax=Streptomyces sp. NBC_00654 TaxID=2975799 RepID=UPI002255922B|nr:hypothetical protein [Streptomyces sp. NBC_00654]MCX4966927.1 hypothetical protein [Streptomyces sp. NBC_00654]